MMELTKKKANKEYDELMQQLKKDLTDFATCKMKEIDNIIEQQEEILNDIKK